MLPRRNFLGGAFIKQETGDVAVYRTLGNYLKERYGTKTRKICIDGGFTCPNRDGTVGRGGCIFCGERGAGEHLCPELSIRAQVERELAKGKADAYIAYFQNFTNTYADTETLRARYDAALIDERIRVIAIGTRPDCIDDDICALIASYKSRLDVWVELGLQTASDTTAAIINRGYTTNVYIQAANLLKKHGIPFVTHIIVGLPGEGEAELDETIELIKAVGTWGVKIHSLYVMEGTRLADMYREKLYTPPTFDAYTSLAARALESLGDSIVVHRITGDCPPGLLVAPAWNADKQAVISEIRRKLALSK